ncbi:hypothetical protein FQN54_005069 [Arachnomyces sp. PD_36]|nr:hypothetical protein FQN54_005069 [Arachnomyces sp. PD_36]
MALFETLSTAGRYGIGIFVTYWLLVFSYRLLLHPLRKYPGPFLAKLSDAYGGYHALKGNLHLVGMENIKKYGPVYRQGPNRLVFSTVEALHDIYDNDRFVKSDAYLTTLGYTGAINIFNVIEKDAHRPRRQLVGSALTERAMRKFEPTMTEEINVFLKQILKASQSSSPVVDGTDSCRRLGIDIVWQLAFGYPLKTQTEPTNRFLQEGITAANVHNNLLIQFPRMNSHIFAGPLHILTAGPRAQAMGFVEKMINMRVSEGKDARQDYYSHIADQLPSHGDQDLRQSEVWSEALFLIPAGGDTTGTTLSSLLFYLTLPPKDPSTPTPYQTLTQEIRSTFTSGSEIRSGPKLSSCTYLRACIDEALRISPPVTGTLWRQQSSTSPSNEPLTVDNHTIPPGTSVAVSIYALHHNPSYFPDPYTYSPSRWLDSNPERRKIMNQAFAPFSLGYRGCGGKAMAYLELYLVIAKLVFYFDFERAGGEEGGVGGGGVGAGGGRNGKGGVVGRERKDEFQLFDSFVSTHVGPKVVFRPRGEVWRELV